MIARTTDSSPPAIRLRGVRQNNLKSIDCDVPLNRFIAITGVSGSGKSSLAFDTLYAEGQRRYVETFSAYTRQFLDRMARPDADSIENVPPAVAIDTAGAIKTSRSTVGTLTGINDYLKLLFARASEAYCPGCGRKVEPEGVGAAVDFLGALGDEAFPALVTAPVPLGGFGSRDTVLRAFTAQGFVRYLRGADIRRIEDLEARDLKSTFIEVVIDRISTAHTRRSRLADSLEQAFRIGRGAACVKARGASRTFTAGLRCGDCSVSLPSPSPGLFSFNNPFGACPLCRGFGRVIEIDFRRVVPDGRLSIREGAVKPFASPSTRRLFARCLRFCEQNGIPTDLPFERLSEAHKKLVFDGGAGFGGVRGFFRHLEAKKYKLHVRVLLARYRGYELCPDCQGARLKAEALHFRLNGKTLRDVWETPIQALRELLEEVERKGLPKPVRLVALEVSSRLRYLDSVGLGYLTLGRQARTLSGGEVERVNLTSALGASLVNTLFVLDEPSIGLHSRDNDRLIGILRQVRAHGNTVVVVEHDPEILKAAEWVLDIGPGSGERGGRIVAEGTVEAIQKAEESLTGAYLSGRKLMPVPATRKAPREGFAIEIRGARENNLKGLDLEIPLGLLVAITGVSGSGKSTLLEDVIWRSYRRFAGEAVEGEAPVGQVKGFKLVDQVLLVDQSPIGRTPRGNPATYTKIHDSIRKLFAGSPDAKAAGFTARHFSFNVEGGRCPECSGAGATQVEMQFLSDVTLPCEACCGKRFTKEVLRVRFRGKTIDETLRMTIREAMGFFALEPSLVEKLNFLDALGLGYLTLGQPINTLSGGESQRLKLAGHVLDSKRGKLLFLLDEPTTGLHLEDVAKLIEVLRGLVEKGHSVVVIEHHLDVVESADWVLDLGPEGGDGGGRLVAEGTPDEIARSATQTGSITGEWLQRHRCGARSEPALSGKPLEPSEGASEASTCIRVVGARENNLKDITVSIPRDQLVVVTGLSGSGKSSLLYDIVFAEGQRRYLDCLSPYARQFVEELHRPDMDHLEGIPPSVAIEQRTTVGGRKSTVGTVTEIYQFLRLLFTRAGTQVCPECQVNVVPRRMEDIAQEVKRLSVKGGRLLAPAIRGKKGFHSRFLLQARRRGVLDARIDGEWLALPEDRELKLDRHTPHDVDLVTARFRTGGAGMAQLQEAIAQGLEYGHGVVRFLSDDGTETVLSVHRSCPQCGRDFDEPDPRNFSFNSRHGACPDCDGYGSRLEIDPERLIDRWDLPVEARPRGPFDCLGESPFTARTRSRFLRALLKTPGLPIEKPLSRWPRRAIQTLLDGDSDSGFTGLRPLVEATLEGLSEENREACGERWGCEVACASCGGGRLRQEWLAVRVGGHGIAEMAHRHVEDLCRLIAGLRFTGAQKAIGEPIAKEVLSRLEFLREVGLGYLTLDRSADTLSTGESQRIRLASQLGSSLRGVAYILDEPTIGLHPRDGAKLIETLRRLRDQGNSVLVVEHDEEVIQAAEHIIEMGPGPGRHGGEVVAQGTLDDILESERSATGAYFRRRGDRGADLQHPAFDLARAIEVQGAFLHNLKDVSVKFPLGAVTLVTGVSGAGKSTLVRSVLEESVRRRLRGLRRVVGCRELLGAELLESVREVDQLPIGRTPRSTPATYVGLWSRIRTIYASTQESKARGYSAGRFSFNTRGGRCETCAGQGSIRLEMSFLPDVSIDCEACRGARFSEETQEVLYRGKNIAQVLQMTVEEAREHFAAYPDLTRQLKALESMGLGYLALGQASTTLSGGEAQRVKLAVELAKSTSGPCLYLLDEPTTGLHLEDVARLVAVLKALASLGHAVVVIEHHLDVIDGAGWVIDLGPEAGDEGGELVYEGPPEGLVNEPRSHTARALSGRRSVGQPARRREP